jgi:hypothetical protein
MIQTFVLGDPTAFGDLSANFVQHSTYMVVKELPVSVVESVANILPHQWQASWGGTRRL